MNDVEKVEEALRNAIQRAENVLTQGTDTVWPSSTTYRRALLDIVVGLNKAPDLSQPKKWDAGDVYPSTSQAAPSLPANSTVHIHESYTCSGKCCPYPGDHRAGLDSKINAIRLVRNQELSCLPIGAVISLKDAKDIVDALDAAGFLRVKR